MRSCQTLIRDIITEVASKHRLGENRSINILPPDRLSLKNEQRLKSCYILYHYSLVRILAIFILFYPIF